MSPAAEPQAARIRALERFVARVGPLAATSEQRETVAALDEAAAEALKAFARANLGALLLKGAALVRLLYADGEQRVYSDVDLLVAPGHLAQARRVLTRLGYRNASEAFGIDDIGGVVHEEMWLREKPAAVHEVLVELHLGLAGAQAAPEIAWEALAARRASIDLNGRQVPVLNREGQAMHLATHAAQHGLRYAKGLRELTLALERWPLETWERAAGLAAEIEALESFAAGLRLVPEGGELAGTLGLPATDRLDWEIEHSKLRPRGTFHLRALFEERGVRARAGVLRRALLPPRQWIAWQHPWARRGTVPLVAAYGLHLVRAPVWAARAWRFRQRASRGGRS